MIGVDDDHSKWLARPDGLVAKYNDLGLEAVRLTIPWRRGEAKPGRTRIYLHRAAMLIERGQRVVIGVFGRPADAPLDAESRHRYCSYLRHVVQRIPFQDVVIWNEANSPAFWPRGEAQAYEALLAAAGACFTRRDRGSTCSARPRRTTTRPASCETSAPRTGSAGVCIRWSTASVTTRTPTTQRSPHGFGTRTRTRSAKPTSIGCWGAIHDGFAGTAQPLPLERGTTVWYLETGFQTTVPRHKRRYYRGRETDLYVVPPVAPAESPTWVRDQASQLRDALLLARCQPAVGAFFNFELLDEDRLAGWQSGVLWRDGTHKPSYDEFRAAISQVRSGAIDCSLVPGAGGPLPPAPPEPTAESVCREEPEEHLAQWRRCYPGPG